MIVKILKKDSLRNKSITIVLLLFIALSMLLVSSGSNIITTLVHSMENLFTTSKTPHFVQMHSGELDHSKIETWATNHKLVERYQTVEMVNLDGSFLFLGDNKEAETSSIMDISFVKQNELFDFLLDLDNQVVQVSSGEIGVPIYYMEKNHLQVGDKVMISNETFKMEFTVSHFIRDALMNPSIVHSKRFLVNEADLHRLKKYVGEREYLIEFQLHHVDQLHEFRNSYQSANLPSQGPVIDYHTFNMLNALTNGIIAVILILVSLLVIIIALLCLRLVLLATLEEDYREIGVMKAIGISSHFIKKIYFIKYFIITILASILGYVASILLRPFFTKNITLYFGSVQHNLLEDIISVIPVVLIIIIIICYCLITLKKFDKKTAVESLHAGTLGDRKRRNGLHLHKSKFINVNLTLGLKDILGQMKKYGLLFFVFIVCSFVIIVPVNFLNTIQSPSFITYMGIGKSDIRIDLQQSDDIIQRFHHVLAHIEKDQDVRQFSSHITSQFKVVNSDGVLENINVEIGDLSIFPIAFLQGKAPTNENEIALSYVNGKELDKDVGDTLRLVMDDQEKEFIVSGIYQDVTNGGRTAKTMSPVSHENVLWYVINVSVESHVDINEKMMEYTKSFQPAKVTLLEDYVAETLGDTVKQLKKLTIVIIGVGLFVSILITALFVKMLIAKDSSPIAIMKSIGFSLKDIQVQYISKTILVLIIAIIVGTFLSNTVGQSIVSALWSLLGAARIEFVIHPIRAYIIYPLLLMACVTVATLLSTRAIKSSNIHKMNVE